MSPGRKLAILLGDTVCRYLLAGTYSSIAQATAQDRELPTPTPSREQVGEALRRLELAAVIEPHKGGRWTLNAAELTDVLALVEQLPAGVGLLENLAHPVGWSVVAHLALRHCTRGELNGCGDAARVSEQLRSPRRPSRRSILTRRSCCSNPPSTCSCSIIWTGSPATCTCAPSRRPARTSSTRSAAAPRVSATRRLRVRRAPARLPEARKAYNYTRAAYERGRSRT